MEKHTPYQNLYREHIALYYLYTNRFSPLLRRPIVTYHDLNNDTSIENYLKLGINAYYQKYIIFTASELKTLENK